MLSELWYWEFARLVGTEMARPVFAGKRLSIDAFLQSHKGVHQSLRTRRAAGDVDIHRDESVDAF